MWMLIRKNQMGEGAYAVFNKKREKVLFFFENEDDANRYAMMLEDIDENSTVKCVEVDPKLALSTCIQKGLMYTVVTQDDFVVPPIL